MGREKCMAIEKKGEESNGEREVAREWGEGKRELDGGREEER